MRDGSPGVVLAVLLAGCSGRVEVMEASDAMNPPDASDASDGWLDAQDARPDADAADDGDADTGEPDVYEAGQEAEASVPDAACLFVQPDLEHAPPPLIQAGQRAVPIDIEKVSASIVCDGFSEVATVDATVTFDMGPLEGQPILDLRQQVLSLSLDDQDVPSAAFPPFDFGS